MRGLIIAMISAAICLTASIASAQQGPSGGVSVGYSHLGISNPDHLLLDRDGAYIDGELGFNFGGYPIGLWLGGGLDFSDYYSSRDVNVPVGNNFFFETTNYSEFSLSELEARLAAPIRFGRDRGLFIQPKIGAGLVYEYYDIDNNASVGNNEVFFTDHHEAVGVEVRPSMQVGYFDTNCSFGLEGSYMAAWGDWGRFGNKLDEYHVGLFANLKW